MTIKAAIPYINYDGTAAQAVEHYKAALGAEVEELQRFGDMPNNPLGPEHADRVMHVTLKIGETKIMMSDAMPNHPYVAGGNVNVSLNFDDPAQTEACFKKLAEGGKVTMELHDAFWGAKFGMLVDRFNVQFMFNCPLPKE